MRFHERHNPWRLDMGLALTVTDVSTPEEDIAFLNTSPHRSFVYHYIIIRKHERRRIGLVFRRQDTRSAP